MNSFNNPGPNRGRNGPPRRNFFDDEVMEEEKAKKEAAEQQQLTPDVVDTNEIIEEREILISKGIDWMKNFSSERKTPIERKLVIEKEALDIETYYVAEMFDEIIQESKKENDLEINLIQLLTKEDFRGDLAFLATFERFDRCVDYAMRDESVSKSLMQVPAFSRFFKKMVSRFDEMNMTRKIETYNIINTMHSRLKMDKYNEVLSVYIHRNDNGLKDLLLSYKHLFVYYLDLVDENYKKKINDLVDHGIFDPKFNYKQYLNENYSELKHNLRRIIVYDCMSFYPHEWLQDKDLENVFVYPTLFIRGHDRKYIRTVDSGYVKPNGVVDFVKKSHHIRNDAFVVHHILSFFMGSDYISVKLELD